jgi:hypothetical protein
MMIDNMIRFLKSERLYLTNKQIDTELDDNNRFDLNQYIVQFARNDKSNNIQQQTIRREKK